MRFITFKKIEAKNFLSIGNAPIVVNLQKGVNAIIGSNLDKEDSKNGCGKSTICDALYYALYGNTLREISKDFITNSLTKKRCEVTLEFNIDSNNQIDEYKIVRKLDPTKCQIFKNDEEITLSTLAKTNNYIQSLLRTPATVFQNSIIMSVNNTIPFMALSKIDKRKFIESILGLEVFTSMVLKARDDYNILKKDYEIAYNKFEISEKEFNFSTSQLENYETSKAERLNKQVEKKQTLINDIQTLENKLVDSSDFDIGSIDEQIKELDAIKSSFEDKKTKVQTKLFEIQAEINAETKQIKKLETAGNDCPTCKRTYSQEHIDHVASLIQENYDKIEKFKQAEALLKDNLQESQNKITNAFNDIQEFTQKKNNYLKVINDNNSVNISIEHLKQNLKDVETEIQLISSEHNNELKGKIATLKTEFEQYQTKVNTFNDELNVLETVKFVISEEGIKSFLVKKIITVLNSRLAFYLKKLEANCLCQFDEFFEEQILDENSQLKSYFNFSGGERKRIDLACLFAFADIRRLQGDVNFSTIFYDELLDSSLDDKGVFLTLKILQDRFNENNESCYIITHRTTYFTAKANHIIHVVKQNGLTRLAD